MLIRQRTLSAFFRLMDVSTPALSLGLVIYLSVAAPLTRAQSGQAWTAEVRERVAARQMDVALAVVDRRLGEAPQDLEARGWRARILAWSGRWPEAEAEFRRVLEAAPGDVDILLGLADVLRWQKRLQDSLALLDRARELEPQRAEVHARRGRVLTELGRREAARAAYERALALDPASTEARAGLDALAHDPRHELRLSGDFDAFDFAEDAQSVTTTLRSQLGSRWTSLLGGNFQHRFGQDVGRFLGSLSVRATRRDTFTAGGVAGRDAGVVSKGEAFFEYSRGIRVSESGAVRGLELGYRQQWLWFRDARVLALAPTALVYLPRDWTWSLSVAAARSRFPGTPAEWRPSGSTRLTFPLHRGVSGNVFFAVGTENFAQADQVGRFSARTWGGGARWRITRRHDVSAYVFHQNRSQQRREIGFGFSYGFRF
jgi:tetratricopeptide (TPR) repeat protein